MKHKTMKHKIKKRPVKCKDDIPWGMTFDLMYRRGKALEVTRARLTQGKEVAGKT